MFTKRSLLIFVLSISIVQIKAQPPNVFALDGNHLASLRTRIQQKDKDVLRLIDSLTKQADKLLKMMPVSVMDKEFTPPSGTKHDYMSQAPYYWYDSTKPGGLPYVRKDGVRNPEIYKITDRVYLGRLENASRRLSLAYYFTGDNKYADKAAALLRHWFTDDDTKMNPHLEYAQAIRGINDGRGIGIIETRNLIGIVDAIGLLEGASSWTKNDTKAMQNWFAKYLDWLLNSKNGKDEYAAKNNHGTWYYAQAISFALFIENKELAKKLAGESKKRLDSQLTTEGRQPLELARTNALGYSTMNLQGWFTVANLAEKAGVDIWDYKTSNGATLQIALDWLIPYAIGDVKWTYQQITEYDKEDIYSLIAQAKNKFKIANKIYTDQKIAEKFNDPLIALLYTR